MPIVNPLIFYPCGSTISCTGALRWLQAATAAPAHPEKQVLAIRRSKSYTDEA
jgi:hypothetical protein